MADRLYIEIDQKALEEAVSYAEGVRVVLQEKTDGIIDNANALSSGFRTQRTYNYAEHKWVGDTQPEYGGDVQMGSRGYIGLVHPKNYAAMKDNYLHNTLLKARG